MTLLLLLLFAPAAALAGWVSLPSLPVDVGECAAATVGDRLYVMAEGWRRTLRYDFTTGKWADPNALAERPRNGDHHTLVEHKGKLYLVGGLGSAAGTIQVYNPANDNWERTINIPWNVAGSVNTWLLGDTIYICGGIASGTVDTCGTYDISQDRFDTFQNMPVGVNHAGFATDGNRLWVFGGRSGGNAVAPGFNYVQLFSIKKRKWKISTKRKFPNLPQARGGMGPAVYYNKELYVIGGETNVNNGPPNGVYSRVDIYSPSRKSWRRGPDLPQGMHGIYAILHKCSPSDAEKHCIYIAGGGVRAGFSRSRIFLKLDLRSTGVVAQKPTACLQPSNDDFEAAPQADGMPPGWTHIRFEDSPEHTALGVKASPNSDGGLEVSAAQGSQFLNGGRASTFCRTLLLNATPGTSVQVKAAVTAPGTSYGQAHMYLSAFLPNPDFEESYGEDDEEILAELTENVLPNQPTKWQHMILSYTVPQDQSNQDIVLCLSSVRGANTDKVSTELVAWDDVQVSPCSE
eukprot:m.158124 g.158124  ORF g.158124 m.158124 type:complete len:517 (-) comp20873_c2_seq1:56-1606(-)